MALTFSVTKSALTTSGRARAESLSWLPSAKSKTMTCPAVPPTKSLPDSGHSVTFRMAMLGVIHVWSLTHFPLFTFLDFHRWQVNYNSLQGKAFLSLPFYQYKQVKLGFTRACRGKKGLGKNLVKNG